MEKQKHSVETAKKHFDEDIVLSGIVKFGREGYAECCDLLNEDVFPTFIHSALYKGMSELFNEGRQFNVLSVFQKSGLPPEMYDQSKAILSSDIYSSTDIRPTALKIRKGKIKEQAIAVHRNCINELMKLDGTEPISRIIQHSERALFDLVGSIANTTDNNPVHIGSMARNQVEDWMMNPVQNVGLPLPWPRFNASIGGGLRSGVHIVGARLKVGKTSIGLMTALHAASLGIPVLILDTEMMIKDVLPRLLASLSEVEINQIERGVIIKDELKKKKVFNSIEFLEKSNIFHRNVGGYDFDEIVSTIRRWMYTDVGFRENGQANPMLVIYDYFKVMNAKELTNINETQALGFQVTKLVDFSKKYDFPCMSFAQLNRDGISREDSAAIGNSDRLAQLANSVSLFKRKTEEEIRKDGELMGNRKLITTDSRYGGEMEFASEYIHMNMKKEYCILQEVADVRKPDAEF